MIVDPEEYVGRPSLAAVAGTEARATFVNLNPPTDGFGMIVVPCKKDSVHE